MAITKDRKQAIVEEVRQLLQDSKLTVITNYKGLNVDQFQTLRQEAKDNQVIVKVIKNRLFKLAAKDCQLDDNLTNQLQGMLVYVFSNEDEIKGAQIVRHFINKFNYPLEFICGIDDDYQLIDKEQVAALANMSSKPVLIAKLASSLNSPMSSLQANLQAGLPYLLNNLKVHKN